MKLTQASRERLLDRIEYLELRLWKYDEESHKREQYLVDKIERLEEELRQAEKLLRCGKTQASSLNVV